MPAVLDRLKQKLVGKSDDDLRAEQERLQAEAREFRTAHRAIRDDAHGAIDARFKEATVMLDARLSSHDLSSYPLISSSPGDTMSIEYLYGLHRLATDEAFHARLHTAVDTAEGFSTLSRAEVDATLAGYDASIREIGVELERREVAARKASVDQELAKLEARVS